MIGSKMTQSFRMNPGEQVSSLAKDNTNYVSAADKKKMGDENVGDVLNRIADANWVDPKKMRKIGNSNLDKDAFLKLMLTQMKNQDPTTPLESHEMAAQLAQFTSLEQMQNMNTGIDKLVKASQPNTQFQALQFIGKSVESDSSKFFRAEGDKSNELRFSLAKDAKEVEVSVLNSDGDLVRTYQLADLKEGQNSLTWNGLNSKDQEVRPGDYTFSVKAKNEDGTGVASNTVVSGKITGVNYTASGPMLLIGKQSIPLSEVKKIVDPSLGLEKSTEVKDVTDLALKKDDTVSDNGEKAKEAPKDQGNIMNVPMERGLLNQVKKATKES